MRTVALIPVYNDAYCLGLCLRSVVDRFDRVIVLDDASTGDTPDVAADFARAHKGFWFYRHDGPQLGWIEARNHLLAHCPDGFDQHFWLDSDDVMCDLEEGVLSHMAGRGRIVRLGLCEMWGDLNHTTQRLRHYDRCHVYINRRLVGDYTWKGGAMAKLANCEGIRLCKWGEVLFFHLKGVKPDRRLVERHMIRKWLRAGKVGTLREFSRIDSMTGAEIHALANRVLFQNKENRLAPTYLPGGAAVPLRPAVIEHEVQRGQRFEILYKDGQPFDRTDRFGYSHNGREMARPRK